MRLVLLVMGVELHGAADDLLVELVRADGLNLDHDRLVHRVGDDDAAPLLSTTLLVLGLLETDDRLARRRLLARRPRALATLAARDVLQALLARLARRRSRRLL